MLDGIIAEQRESHRWGTAHIYRSTYNSLSLFNKGTRLPFKALTAAWLKEYEIFLRARGCGWNTVATYMKVVKAVYNRALDSGEADYVPRLFAHVHTSMRNERKKAIEPDDMRVLLQEAASVSKDVAATPAARSGRCSSLRSPLPLHGQAGHYFVLMFLLRGIPFVDLAYLRKSDVHGDTLSYRRRKTGRLLTVTLTPEAHRLIRLLRDTDPDNVYLFPILHSCEGSEAAYREYQQALRRLNRALCRLSSALPSHLPLTTYAARHTWATLAYHCEVHPGVISEAMGHSSIAVTETYLKPFRTDRIDAANRRVIDFLAREQPDREFPLPPR